MSQQPRPGPTPVLGPSVPLSGAASPGWALRRQAPRCGQDDGIYRVHWPFPPAPTSARGSAKHPVSEKNGCQGTSGNRASPAHDQSALHIGVVVTGHGRQIRATDQRAVVRITDSGRAVLGILRPINRLGNPTRRRIAGGVGRPVRALLFTAASSGDAGRIRISPCTGLARA